MSKAERTKQLIIEKAAIVFNEKGITGTSVDDILRAAKIAKASLYSYFDSKEDLCDACVDYLLQQLTNKRDECISKHSTARAKILAVLDMSKNPLNFIIDGGCPIINFSIEADNSNKLIVRKMRAVIKSYSNLYTDILQGGIDRGEFSRNLQPEEYAMKMFAAIEGAIPICRVMNSTRPMQLVLNSLRNELNQYGEPGDILEKHL